MVNCNNLIIKKTARSGVATATNPLLFDHIFILVLENKSYRQVFSSSSWNTIIQSSAWFTGMYAITHPSQPNYIAMVTGSTMNHISNDYFSTNQKTIVDSLNKAGVSWKSYQENYTSLQTETRPNCNDAMELSNGLYVRRHNPFMFSTTVRNSVNECKKIVNADQLAVDLANNKLPQFSFYTPNMKNNAHDTDLHYAARYLQNWLNTHLNDPSFINGTLLIVTFDEDNISDQTNHIAAFMWGKDYLYSGVSIPGIFNHYSLPKLLEENWGLDSLNRSDVAAPSIMDIWRPIISSNNTNTTIASISSSTTRKQTIIETLYAMLFIFIIFCTE